MLERRRQVIINLSFRRFLLSKHGLDLDPDTVAQIFKKSTDERELSGAFQ
jgi:hypothetical protein